MSPAATSFSNCARVGAGSVPLKPPMAMTASPVDSWYPAASLAPTVASTHLQRDAPCSRYLTRVALGLLALSRPPNPPVPPAPLGGEPVKPPVPEPGPVPVPA